MVWDTPASLVPPAKINDHFLAAANPRQRSMWILLTIRLQLLALCSPRKTSRAVKVVLEKKEGR
jgi:hypothetical protein